MEDRRALTIITPEHVEVRLIPAGLGSRFLAITIDSVLSMLLPIFVFRLVAPLLGTGIGFAFQATAAVVTTWGYHVWFETRRQGQTPGKRAAGLRVVDDRGLPMTVQQSLVRNVVRALDVAPIFYGFGAITAIMDPWSRRLGDIVARTLVIEEPVASEFMGLRDDGRRFTSLRVPHVVRGIRHRISLEERELLIDLVLRAETMTPERCYALMEEVGSHYRRRLDIDDPNLSNENIVRGIVDVLSQRY